MQDWTVRDRLGMLISTVARMKRTRFDNCAREIGLTRPQWRTLNGIKYQPGINQSQLAALLEVGHITVTRQLDSLESLGWVERRPDPADRRSWLLYLTPKVAPIFDQINVMVEMLHDEAYAGLSARELAQLEKILKKIHGNVKAGLKDASHILPAGKASAE